MIGPELALGIVAVLLAVSIIAAVLLAAIYDRAEHAQRRYVPWNTDLPRKDQR